MATEKNSRRTDELSLRPAARIKQRRLLGCLLSSLGTVGVGLGALSGSAAYTLLRKGEVVHHWLRVVIELALMVALLSSGRRAIRQGKRHRMPIIPGLADLSDRERIVLFLRAFADDDGFAQIMIGSARAPWATTSHTEEQQLARALAPFGTLIALGRPADRLPQVGAVRGYASDEEWRSQLLAALDRADLVLLACGPGQSLQWEVEQIVAWDEPERLVLVVARDAEQYESFRAESEGFFPKGLPSWKDRAKATTSEPARAYTRGAIWFDADWTPHLVSLGSWDSDIAGQWLIKESRWVESAFPLAIRPVYRRAGLSAPGQPMTLRPRPWSVNLSVLLLAVCGGSFWSNLFHVPRQDPWVMALMALPCAALLYRTWRGGPLAIGITMSLTLLSEFGVIISLFATKAPISFVPALLFGVGMGIGGLLLLRRDVRDWVASRALKELPGARRESAEPADN